MILYRHCAKFDDLGYHYKIDELQVIDSGDYYTIQSIKNIESYGSDTTEYIHMCNYSLKHSDSVFKSCIEEIMLHNYSDFNPKIELQYVSENKEDKLQKLKDRTASYLKRYDNIIYFMNNFNSIRINQKNYPRHYEIRLYKVTSDNFKGFMVCSYKESKGMEYKEYFKTRIEADYNFGYRSSKFPARFSNEYPTLEIFKAKKGK